MGTTGNRYELKAHAGVVQTSRDLGDQVLYINAFKTCTGRWVVIPIGDTHKAFSARTRQRGNVALGKTKRAYYVGVRVKGIHQQKTANNGFNITLPVNAVSKLKARPVGKRNEVKGIAQPQEFPQEWAAQIITHLKVIIAHTCRRIQKQHYITRSCLSKTRQRDERTQQDPDSFFHRPNPHARMKCNPLSVGFPLPLGAICSPHTIDFKEKSSIPRRSNALCGGAPSSNLVSFKLRDRLNRIGNFFHVDRELELFTYRFV
jgi:hypothetical protein